MAQRRYNHTSRANGAQYQYGSAARDIDIRRELEQPYDAGQEANQKQAKAPHFNFLAMALISISIVICGMGIVNYVQLRSHLTSTIKSVASKQVALESLVSENEEAYTRISTSIDLQEIEAVARGELGMGYAQEGQIITYTSAGTDYMRRVDNGK